MDFRRRRLLSMMIRSIVVAFNGRSLGLIQNEVTARESLVHYGRFYVSVSDGSIHVRMQHARNEWCCD